MRRLTSLAARRKFAGFLPVGPTSLHALLWIGDVDRVVAMWNDWPGSVTTVQVPAQGTATDLLGAPIALTTSGGSATITLSEAAGPVFLTYLDPNARLDAGTTDTRGADYRAPDAGVELGQPVDAAVAQNRSSGCSCRAVAGSPSGLALASILLALTGLWRTRRRRAADQAEGKRW